MKIKNLLKKLLFMIALCTPLLLSAQVDTRGTDFWLAFGNNGNNAAPTSVDLQIRVVADQATTGTIHFTELGTSIPFSIPAGGVFTHVLNNDQKTAVYSRDAGTSSKTARIQTNNPVTVFALNQLSLFTDATNVLPVQTLGTEYFQVQHVSNSVTWSGGYLMIAIEDNTQIVHGGTSITLNAGQVHYFRTMPDLTGTHIISDKPIAFFSVQTTMIHTPGADHLFQQLAPVNTWGRDFIVPVTLRGVERVRIVASQNGTNITQTGGTLITTTGGQTTLSNLNVGQWVELEITLANNGAFIQSNHPIAVCVFMVSNVHPGITNDFGQGDPAMAWIPPIEQTARQGLIAPFVPQGTTVINRHYATIVTPTATKDNTTMRIGTGEAQPLSGGVWNHNAASGMSFYNVELTNPTASYIFTNLAGLFIMGYGLATGSESYHYLAASAMRILDVAFYANNIHNQDLETNPFGVSGINFRAEVQGDISTSPNHIRWFIDGVEDVSLRDQLTWNRNLPNGTYLIVLEVLMDDNITVRQVEGTLTIAIPFIKVNPHVKKRLIEE